MRDKNQKKLMLLGGLRYLLPVIETAHRCGIHVITVDYLPQNIAHKYSDEYYNINIMDKDAILNLAKKLEIDGILSFAVDPGVVTAAYVAEKMHLPFQGSYESAKILQDKAKFRTFLKEHNFNVPMAKGYNNVSEAIADVHLFNWPVIVKPVDSAGSKGVSKIDDISELENAIKYALSESHSGRFIIEDFLEKEGYSSDSECFSVDGKLVCCTFSDQRFDKNAENPYTPAAFSWPSTMPEVAQSELFSDIQRLISLLELRTGIYNVETRLCKNGKTYIMEVSPRGGGNRLAEMVEYSTGIKMIDNVVRAAVGEPVENISMQHYNGYLAEVVLHADKEGKYVGLDIESCYQPYIIETDIWISQGDIVHPFTGANNAIGTIVLRFSSRLELETALDDVSSWCKVIVE